MEAAPFLSSLGFRSSDPSTAVKVPTQELAQGLTTVVFALVSKSLSKRLPYGRSEPNRQLPYLPFDPGVGLLSFVCPCRLIGHMAFSDAYAFAD